MKKGLVILCLLLLLGGTASAEVSVFFLPESGFLRVQGEVTIRPAIASPSFMLFPGVQITELWADELQEYNVQRGMHGTMVSLSLRQVRPQVLSFAYEGFLDLQGSQYLLDRSTLWFPEFSFPFENAQIDLVLPDSWEIVNWQSQAPMYPSLVIRDTTAALAEDVAPVIPVQDELSSRIQMQLARLTSAVNQRHVTEIEALLSPSLKETGLARYLASIPPSYGSISSELQDPFTFLLKTERGYVYEASVVWQESQGRLVLQSFQMTPQGAQVPSELLPSIESFVNDLRLLVQEEKRDQLLLSIAEDIAQGQDQVVEFFLSLNATEDWTVTTASEVLVPFIITLFVPHTEDTKFLLHLGLEPGTENWLIHSLEIVSVG